MSTISLHHKDRSDLLCKRFAHLASSYFDTPELARESEALIPLENLFRVLQMFRYEAFSDPRRSGILALRGFGQPELFVTEESWHEKIEASLRQALNDVFGASASKDDAVGEIQSALRWLATNHEPPTPEVRARTKAFLERFMAGLS